MLEVLFVILFCTLLVLVPLTAYAAWRLMPRRYKKTVFFIALPKFRTMLTRPGTVRITDQRRRQK
jgi:hypothetical protein